MALNKDLCIKIDYISKMVYYYFTNFQDRKMIANTQSNFVLSSSFDPSESIYLLLIVFDKINNTILYNFSTFTHIF